MSTSPAIDPGLYARLRRLGRKHGVSPDDALRRLLDANGERLPATVHDRAQHLCGSAGGTHDDVSSNLRHYLDGYGQ